MCNLILITLRDIKGTFDNMSKSRAKSQAGWS